MHTHSSAPVTCTLSDTSARPSRPQNMPSAMFRSPQRFGPYCLSTGRLRSGWLSGVGWGGVGWGGVGRMKARNDWDREKTRGQGRKKRERGRERSIIRASEQEREREKGRERERGGEREGGRDREVREGGCLLGGNAPLGGGVGGVQRHVLYPLRALHVASRPATPTPRHVPPVPTHAASRPNRSPVTAPFGQIRRHPARGRGAARHERSYAAAQLPQCLSGQLPQCLSVKLPQCLSALASPLPLGTTSPVSLGTGLPSVSRYRPWTFPDHAPPHHSLVCNPRAPDYRSVHPRREGGGGRRRAAGAAGAERGGGGEGAAGGITRSR